MAALFFLVLGLVGLWVGSQAAVGAAVKIAERYGLSPRFIGLTILAVGTDLPETVVAVSATADQLRGIDTTGLILGNSIGSAVTQISIVLGIASLAGAMTLARRHVVTDGLALLASVGLVAVLALDGTLSRTDGVVLLLAYAIYYATLWSTQGADAIGNRRRGGVPWSDLGMLVTGLTLLGFAAETVVNRSVSLANTWGVATSFVAIVIVGVGTSLPELAISLKAALDRKPGLSVGNLVGSNIYDLLIPIGIGAAGTGLLVEKGLLGFDLIVLFGVSALVILFLLRKDIVTRPESFTIVAIYLGYVALKITGVLTAD